MILEIKRWLTLNSGEDEKLSNSYYATYNFPQFQTKFQLRKPAPLNLRLKQHQPYGKLRWCQKSKEQDPETGLYYYGARYLDPRTSRWLSTDPAMGDYVPQSPINDEAKKHNENLPGMGGVFNYVNLHVYHYAGNNPVKLVDPDGRDSIWEIDETAKTIKITIPVEFESGTTAEQQQMFYEAAKKWEGTFLIGSDNYSVTINVTELVGVKKYRGVNVNKIEFSSLERNDDANNGKPVLIPNVHKNRKMTLYEESSLDKVLIHEVGHLLGLIDRYYEKTRPDGSRYTPPHELWESNIMGSTYLGVVGGRNFEEGIQRKGVNKMIYMNRK